MNMEQYWRAYDKTLEPPDEPTLIAECECCSEELRAGEEAVKFDGLYYCSTDCLVDSLDYTLVELEEE